MQSEAISMQSAGHQQAISRHHLKTLDGTMQSEAISMQSEAISMQQALPEDARRDH